MTVPHRSPANRLLKAGFLLSIALYVTVILAKPGVFFADDSYFYFQVAWNFAHGMGSTFNGVMDTNGYHPLWMLICALVCKLLHTKTAAIHGIAAALCLCDLLMLWLVQRILARVADNTWWIAFVLLVPFSFLSQLGTEGALSGCLLAATVLAAYCFVCGPTPGRALLFNLAAALAVLARLDNIFIIGFLWLAVCLAAPVAQRASVLRLQLFCIPVYLALAINRPAQSVDHPAYQLRPYGNLHNFTGTLDYITFTDILIRIIRAKDYHPDAIFFQI